MNELDLLSKELAEKLKGECAGKRLTSDEIEHVKNVARDFLNNVNLCDPYDIAEIAVNKEGKVQVTVVPKIWWYVVNPAGVALFRSHSYDEAMTALSRFPHENPRIESRRK